jgi:hypothetical protein
MRVATSAYLALAIGSISLFLIASAAPGEAKNAINRLALSTFRAGRDGGREHLGELDIRPWVVHALCRQDLAQPSPCPPAPPRRGRRFCSCGERQ